MHVKVWLKPIAFFSFVESMEMLELLSDFIVVCIPAGEIHPLCLSWLSLKQEVRGNLPGGLPI